MWILRGERHEDRHPWGKTVSTAYLYEGYGPSCHILNLRKSYDALDRYRCLDILVGYEVEPRTLCILQIKWVCLQVVAKSGGGYRNVLQSHCKVTQGVPLSPMIFNVVVNSFIRHWVTVVGGAKEDAGQEVLGTSTQALSALFYAGYGPIAPPESARLQGVFDALTASSTGCAS